MNRVDQLAGQPIETTGPVRLFDDGSHSVWWVGSQEDSPFRCNAYLVVDGDMVLLFDPGSAKWHFEQVKSRVAAVVDPTTVTHLVLHHQDPDLCDSLPNWLEVVPKAKLVTTPRTRVLLPYYGLPEDAEWIDVSPQDRTWFDLPSGRSLGFLVAPFLHFPEAMVTFDEASGFMFTGDVGAAIERDWRLVAADMDEHWKAMVPFHAFYMASNRALRGFVEKVEKFPITALLPQHGSIIPGPMVADALARLKELPCGVDLVYPSSRLERELEHLTGHGRK